MSTGRAFEIADDVNLPQKWETDYLRGTDGWDLGSPTPVFERLLQSGRFRPGRAVVLGAGRGHDARAFARHGFRVTAVDFSAYAAAEMRRLAEPTAELDILQHDIFSLPARMDHAFEYVIEYTCFCAIDPHRRADYADLVARLLQAGGIFIDLAFPLDGRKGGPPFELTPAELLGLFEPRGFRLLSRELPGDSIAPRSGAEELFVFQKAA